MGYTPVALYRAMSANKTTDEFNINKLNTQSQFTVSLGVDKIGLLRQYH